MGNTKKAKRKSKKDNIDLVKIRAENDRLISDSLGLNEQKSNLGLDSPLNIDGDKFAEIVKGVTADLRLNYNDAAARGYSYQRMPKLNPKKLEVSFPIISDNNKITQSKLNRLLDLLHNMSNDEFTFIFNSGDFLEITPDEN